MRTILVALFLIQIKNMAEVPFTKDDNMVEEPPISIAERLGYSVDYWLRRGRLLPILSAWLTLARSSYNGKAH